jgi:hypothetical protein
MSKFKVGDKVSALVDTKWWRKGDVGVIRKIGNGVKIDIEDVETLWSCDDGEWSFELAEPEVHITSGGTGGGAFAGGSAPVSAYPNPPHIHKDLIIAWANGADIEVSCGDGAFYEISNPQWLDTLEYRIKPTKTSLQIEIEELEAKLVKLKGQL